MVAAANPLESFIWGAGGAKKTPEQVAREREIAAALMQGGMDYSPVDHWLQGAARAAQGGVGAFKDWRADNAEETGRAGFQSQWDSVFGGAPTQTASINPVAQALTATDAVNSVGGGSDFLNSLISNESGGNWAAQNDAVGSGGQVGHFGRLQFGQARLQDAMNAGVIPAGTTPEQFMADPAAQQAVEAWHFADIDQQAANLGLNKYIGQTIGGAQITPEAIRAMAHLGGIGGAQKFLESGGQYNPSDANGTSLLDYAQNHGGAGGGNMQVAQALGAGQPNMQQLMGLASDPWASESQKSIINSLLGQQMQQQDPMYQLQMQAAQQGLTKGDLEIQQMLNPQPAPVDPTSAMQNYEYLIAQGVPPEQALEQAFGGGGTTINNNMGGTDDFYKKLDTDLGEQQVALIEAGQVAQGNNMRLGQLEQHLANAPQGAAGALVQFAGSLGVPMDGLSDVQAAQAIINQMVPGQRPPGSGTMSDADLALFKASLPSIINQPGGNAAIIQTTKAINDYTIQQAEIARQIANRELTPAEGRARQAAIPNPLANFSAPADASAPPAGPSAPTAPAVGVVEDGYRFKGGDPADQNNWEQVQ